MLLYFVDTYNYDRGAFYNCDTIKKLILHSGVEEIEKGAFEKCDKTLTICDGKVIES